MTRREFRDLAPPDAVASAVGSLDIDPGAETVPIRAARGRVLADRVDAGVDVPGFDRAAMDGYAVRAADTVGAGEASPTELAVVGTVEAGEPATATPAPGEAIGIATGAVVPPGADAVVPVERTTERDGAVAIRRAVAPGANVSPRGADIAGGDRALGPGTRLGPRHVGLLAALGRETVAVRGRPQVAVVATGEELVQPGDTLQPEAGQIYDVNSHSIASAAESTGAEVGLYTPASDEPAQLRSALERAGAAAGLVLTSGSTSAGAADHLPRIVEREGEVLVHGVALKPGRPTLVGRIFGTPYVGLPGYPVSAMTVFRTFVADRIRTAAGLPEPARASVEAILRTRVRYDGGRLRLLPVGLVGDGDGGLVAYTLGRGSGATTSLAKTDGVVRMEPGTALLAAGEPVTVERFDADDPVPDVLAVGEPDPVLWELLDAVDAPRFLSMAPRDARRWVDDGVPDALVADPVETDSRAGETLARWNREWGLVVPADNPDGVSGLADLSDGALAAPGEDLALRAAFAREFGDDAGPAVRDLPGLASAARSVAADRAEVGLGLRATAEALGLGFVPAGRQTLVVSVAGSRREKPGIRALREAVSDHLDDALAATPGYEPAGEAC
ncbi:MAG: molybdopterin biosynthesis protein [Salinirussus sp.]